MAARPHLGLPSHLFLVACLIVPSRALFGQSPPDADQASALAAVSAVVDSVCVTTPVPCDTIVVNLAVRSARYWLPSTADSTAPPAFTLSARTARDAALRWPVRVANLGQCCTSVPTERQAWVRVWLVTAHKPDATARKYTVAVQFTDRSAIGIAEVRFTGRRWILRALHFATT